MQEMMGKMVTFFWGHLSPVENYVTLAWGEQMLGDNGQFLTRYPHEMLESLL